MANSGRRALLPAHASTATLTITRRANEPVKLASLVEHGEVRRPATVEAATRSHRASICVTLLVVAFLQSEQ
jgi:hypothetical protein